MPQGETVALPGVPSGALVTAAQPPVKLLPHGPVDENCLSTFAGLQQHQRQILADQT